MKRSLSLLGVVLAVLVLGLSVAAETLTNDSGKTAVAVRIAFMSNVFISRYGREFNAVDPSSGLSHVFVFFDGEVRRSHTFNVEWTPSLPIKSIEWLEEYEYSSRESAQDAVDCSSVISTSQALETQLRNAYDGMVLCLEPGTYNVGSLTVQPGIDLTIRGINTEAGVARIESPPYKSMFLSASEGSLRIEDVWLGDRIELVAKGDSDVTVNRSRIYSVVAYEFGKVQVDGSEIGFLWAKHAADVQLADCLLGNGLVGLNAAIWAHDDVQIVIRDSTIRGEVTGIVAMHNSSITLIRTEIRDCESEYRIRDSASVEVEDH